MNDKEKILNHVERQLATIKQEYIKTLPHGLCTKCYCTGRGYHNTKGYSFICDSCNKNISINRMWQEIKGVRP